MIKTTKAQEAEIAGKIMKGRFDHDEKVWTWLVARLLDDKKNAGRLEAFRLFTDREIQKSDLPRNTWFEAQPISPRKGEEGQSEGNTHLDLAFGGVGGRGATESGIKFNKDPDSKNEDYPWVCFVEAKLFSDCSLDTANDPFRNQLSRVIENLVTFQGQPSEYPDKIYFTLLTPKMFKEKPFTRLYGYKFFEFMDRDNLLRDFEMCKIDWRNDASFEDPAYVLKDRLKKLKLNWVTFEDVFDLLLQKSDMDPSDETHSLAEEWRATYPGLEDYL